MRTSTAEDRNLQELACLEASRHNNYKYKTRGQQVQNLEVHKARGQQVQYLEVHEARGQQVQNLEVRKARGQ